MKKELFPIKCQICNKECNGLYGLTYHLSKTHKYGREQVIDYYDTYFLEESDICACGKKKKFGTLDTGYAKTCGNQECITTLTNETKEINCIEKYGVTHTSKLDSTKQASKKTREEKYGDDYGNNREKSKRTCLENYGVENYTQTDEYNEKVRIKAQENYGVDHHLSAPKIIEIRTQTNLRERGVKNVFQDEDVKSISKISMVENHGVEYALQSPTIMKRVQDEFIVNHSRRLGEFTKEEREKGHLIIMSAKYNELLNSDKYNTKVKPLFSLKEYKGVYKDHNWLCLKCGEEFEDCLNNMKVPRCPTCNPRLAGRSVGEKEVFDFLADYIYCEDNKQWRFKLLMKIQQNQKKSVKITCFLTRNSVYLRSER